MDDRADFYVDQSKLPGVREVCRDFAVLEDHTLAHNLQEQEIEHHLATNVHRHRLVQHDLKVAKKLQEEEDVKAWTERQKKKKKDLERHDNEVAHVFQEELVIQAQQRRWQEEKDESVARKLQQKELKEEKRRNKHKDITGHVPYEDSCSDPYGGVKQRGLRDVSHGVAQLSVRDQKLKDADIARRLQEEELMMNKIVRFDSKTAQMAQDEEIARFLMEEENREFRKDKDKNKMSFEKRRQDKKHEQSNLVHACAKESYESSSSRTEPSSRSPVLGQQFESPVRLSPVYSSPRRAIPRPEYVHKGS
ncbi:coiled-coil domain-containing protein 50 isoform X2 [Protopterus annectens]|uniref:coiled-coil domain-containing protein 50 isoform X2 n=1 Tax=Protopterus annectens TaxID=7888 RepID=UPI001CF93298|nr:coiled-coil domain-containing protein 50 isoform X2 [Protopterus annectens]